MQRMCAWLSFSGCAQAEYHQEKFRAFPHVDSPARLIKEIVKPPVKRAVAQQQE